MSHQPRVTVCVPVYNGADFVTGSLTSIAMQRYPHLEVHVSDDASTDESGARCAAFAADPRFRISHQAARRGWVEHCNWLLRQATTEFVSIVSHDDLLEPDHITSLVDVLDARPDCALAFSDIRVFGLLEHVEYQPSVEGASPVERVRAFMATHFDGTAFHALVRRSALEVAGGLTENAMDHFAADVTWLGRLTRAGGFRRVPSPLYVKRRHAASASLRWGSWSADTMAEAWGMHCRELLLDALADHLTPEERQAVADAALRRLLAIEPPRPFTFIRDFRPARQAAMTVALLAGLGSGG